MGLTGELSLSGGTEEELDRRRRRGGRPEDVVITVAEVVFMEVKGVLSTVERVVRELLRCIFDSLWITSGFIRLD